MTHTQEVALKSLVLPACAGIFATVLTHPLDIWVVHAQTGRRDQLKAALRTEGVRVFLRGLGPATLQAALIYSVMFGTYDLFRDHFHQPYYIAAALAAFPESAVKGPLEAFKNLRQTNRPIRAMAIAQGTFGMLLREVPGNVAYFGAYETVFEKSGSALLGGMCAGVAFTGCVYPLDAMRTQLVTGVPLRFTYRGSGQFLVRAITITGLLFASLEASRSLVLPVESG